jgi:phosphoesterase RecJ-like protein
MATDHPPPRKYRFLDPGGLVEAWEEKPPSGALQGLDLGVFLDASEPSRAGCLEEVVGAGGMEWICLDHHPGPVSARFSHHWVAPRAPATGNMVLRLLDALGTDLDHRLASALFTAIGTDTGWFRFSNTTALCLRDSARLAEAGAKPEDLYTRIYEDHSPERMALLGRVFSGLTVELGGRYIWSLIDRSALERSGVPQEELDGFVEGLRSIRGAEVVALVVEVAPGELKASLRARGDAAVNEIAAFFGGGGHAKAAGFQMAGEAGAVLSSLRRRVEEALRALPGAGGSGGDPRQPSGGEAGK